jgi:transcriptional regulator with XRE-family HTH domain
MTMRHVFRKSTRSAEESARLRADRERYQRERPTPEQLLAEGGHADFVPLGDVLELHQVLAGLKEAREHKNLTLADVSKRAGIDQAALSRLETGRNSNPTFATIQRIAAALGKAISWTFRDIPPDAGWAEQVGHRETHPQSNHVREEPIMKTVWRLVVWHLSNREERQSAVDWAVSNRRIAIGWGKIGDIRQLSTPGDVKKAIQREYSNNDPNNWRYGGDSVYDFCYRMKPGDLVILSTGKGGGPVLVMEITGPYEYFDDPHRSYPNDESAYRYQRKARIVDMDPDQLWKKAGRKPLGGQNVHRALVQGLNCVDHAALTRIGENRNLHFDVGLMVK